MRRLFSSMSLLAIVAGCSNSVPGPSPKQAKTASAPKQAKEVVTQIPAPKPLPAPKVQLVAQEKGWSTIKGKFVYDGNEAPKPEKVDVTGTDKAFCLKNGDVYSEKWVVDPKTKAVRDVFIWIEKEGGGAPPIHKKLKPVSKKDVVLDQPCCQFIPHVVAMRQGQTLIVKNSAQITHNFRLSGIPPNKSVNINMLAGTKITVKDLKPPPVAAIPISATYNCDAHKWMKGYLRVFDHPYFAVTKKDGAFEIPLAPAGKYRLFVWHPTAGWLDGFDDAAGGPRGREITIRDSGVTNLGVLKIK